MTRTNRATIVRLMGVLLGPATICHGIAADSARSPAPVVATNFVRVTNVVVVIVTNYVVTTNLVLSTNDTKSGREKAALPDVSWVPPVDTFDWIQLKSGEWLKGRVQAMQNRKLEFDSEELDDLEFDWKDIRQVRSPRTIDVLFVDGELLSGPVTITPQHVLVGAETARTHPRDQLQSLTPGGSRERNHWSGKAALGLTLRAGNTKQVEFNAMAHLERRTPATRFSLDYVGNMSRVDEEESANNNRVNTEFDLWLSRRFYLIIPFGEYYKDPFQNLAHRVTLGAGVGYDVIARPNLEWTFTTGPAYQKAWFDSSQPDEPTEKATGALVFGSRFDWDVTRRIDLILEYRGQYTSREAGESTHHAVATLSIDLTKRFDLDVSFIWDRIDNPKVGSDGIQPLPDDFRLVVGLAVDF